jgi:hypothetical protein
MAMGLVGDSATESTADAASASATDSKTGAAIDFGTACTVSQPRDWANWPVSDSPDQFKDSGDGTTFDANTGLTWMKAPASGGPRGDGTFTWAEAQALCTCPWRLPQRIELLSIVDYTKSDPAMNTSQFAATSKTYWTATHYQGSSALVDAVDFRDGDMIMATTGDVRYVRCVQGGAGVHASRYTISTNPSTGVIEVYDALTKLYWKQATEPDTYNWANAKARCVSPYRLPSISELQTLADTTNGIGTADPIAFPRLTKDNVWSSTPYQPTPSSGWFVGNYSGFPGHVLPGNAYAVRCVR